MAQISKRVAVLFAFASLGVAVSGCKNSTPASGISSVPSGIVATVVNAGAGDVSGSSRDGLQLWFGNHLTVAQAIHGDCDAKYKQAQAAWAATDEGKVCIAGALAEASAVGTSKPHVTQSFIGQGGIHGNKAAQAPSQSR